MPRARDPNIDKAKELYDCGMKLVEIASQLNVPAGTVRRWKCTYKWDNEQSERSEKKSERSVKLNKEKKKVVEKEVKQLMSNTELTEKQRLFCLYYSKSFNATRSYQKAYECAYDSATVNGARLLTKDKVKAEIMRLKEERYARAFLREDDIFQKYMDIAFADVTDYLKFGTTMMESPDVEEREYNYSKFRDWNSIDGTIISEVKIGKLGDANIKLADRMKALQWLSDHMDLATEEQKARIESLKSKNKIEVSMNENSKSELSELLEQRRKRVDDNAIE